MRKRTRLQLNNETPNESNDNYTTLRRQRKHDDVEYNPNKTTQKSVRKELHMSDQKVRSKPICVCHVTTLREHGNFVCFVEENFRSEHAKQSTMQKPSGSRSLQPIPDD